MTMKGKGREGKGREGKLLRACAVKAIRDLVNNQATKGKGCAQAGGKAITTLAAKWRGEQAHAQGGRASSLECV